MIATDKPFRIFGQDLIGANAIEQMEAVMEQDEVSAGALMPDAHLGYEMPIGGVAHVERAISPSYIGYDISCMMKLSLFHEWRGGPMSDVSERYFVDILREVTRFGVGASFSADERRDHSVMSDPRWDEVPILKEQKSKARAQLGTSGAGNHFVNLVHVTFHRPSGVDIPAPSQWFGVLSHSGSRGPGWKTAQHYMKRAKEQNSNGGHAFLHEGSEGYAEYVTAMHLMGDYAKANHDVIHAAFADAAGLRIQYDIWNRHNFAWAEGNGWVHRKGATPADLGQPGLIPGSCATSSYVVEGLGHPGSLSSSSHGAGRVGSRKQAKANHDEDAWKLRFTEAGVKLIGVAPDETSYAYKDIDAVIGAQRGTLLDVVATIKPVIVIMGGGR